MATQMNIFDENPSVDGPDYVALVIEWDELADSLERELRGEPSLLEPKRSINWLRIAGVAASTVGAAALAWGIYAWARR